MNAAELRQRRKAAGLTQAELGKRLGLHRDFIGLMERGVQPIAERTALAVTALSLAAPSTGLSDVPTPPLRTTDPMERLIEAALIEAGLRFITDHGGGTEHRLDFHLLDHDIAIEVKRFHTPRIADQMARAPNVIAAQGEAAVRFLAQAIRSGSFA